MREKKSWANAHWAGFLIAGSSPCDRRLRRSGGDRRSTWQVAWESHKRAMRRGRPRRDRCRDPCHYRHAVAFANDAAPGQGSRPAFAGSLRGSALCAVASPIAERSMRPARSRPPRGNFHVRAAGVSEPIGSADASKSRRFVSPALPQESQAGYTEDMKTMQPPVLERILDPVSKCLTPDVARAIVDYRLDSESQAVLDSLAEKSTAGKLTDTERRQYESFVSALDFVAVLQSKARRLLKSQR